jgi:hypothetical protein
MSARSNGSKKMKTEDTPVLEGDDSDSVSGSYSDSEGSMSGSYSTSASNSASLVDSDEESVNGTSNANDSSGKKKTKENSSSSKIKAFSKSVTTKKSKDLLIEPKRKVTKKSPVSETKNGSLEERKIIKAQISKQDYDNMNFKLYKIGDGDKTYIRSVVRTPEGEIQTTEGLDVNEKDKGTISVHMNSVFVFPKDVYYLLGLNAVDKNGVATPFQGKSIPVEYRKSFDQLKIVHNQQGESGGSKKNELGRLYASLSCMIKVISDMKTGEYLKITKSSQAKFIFDESMLKKWENVVESDNRVKLQKAENGNIPRSFLKNRTIKASAIDSKEKLLNDVPMNEQGQVVDACNKIMKVTSSQQFLELLKRAKTDAINNDGRLEAELLVPVSVHKEKKTKHTE